MAETGPLSNQMLGEKYRLGELLGEGGFGEVYQAMHVQLRRRQAIKVLQQRHFKKPEFRKRFEREAQTLAALDHVHIVHVDDFGIEEDGAYIVMPFIGGGTLHHRLVKPLDLRDVERYLEHICAALDYAHKNGVVHLDLKPLNLLVHEDGRILLSDFGLAHLMNHGEEEWGTSRFFGTPRYMAPEHRRGEPERRSDLYALGVILYQMLVGQMPATGPLPSIRAIRPELPEALEAVVEKSMEEQPEDRYQTANELLLGFKAACALQGESYYPGDVSRAMRDCYYQLGGATSPLGSSKWVSSKDGSLRTSRRGTMGYSRRFSEGTLLWSKSRGTLPVWRGFAELYQSLKGAEGRLGFPITEELPTLSSPQGTTGVYQCFEGEQDYPKDIKFPSVTRGATLYHSERHGAYATWGEIGIHFERFGGTGSHLGFPISAELDVEPSQAETPSTGKYQRFEGGAIYWCERGGARSVYGDIAELHIRLGGAEGRLGFPLTAEQAIGPSLAGTLGKFQRFEGGSEDAREVAVYHSTHGVYPVWGRIGVVYESIAGPSGSLGFPTSLEKEVLSSEGMTYWYQEFEGGAIYWCEKYAGVPILRPILTLFEEMGGVEGKFRFPMSAEGPASVSSSALHLCTRLQQFEGGVICVIAEPR